MSEATPAVLRTCTKCPQRARTEAELEELFYSFQKLNEPRRYHSCCKECHRSQRRETRANHPAVLPGVEEIPLAPKCPLCRQEMYRSNLHFAHTGKSHPVHACGDCVVYAPREPEPSSLIDDLAAHPEFVHEVSRAADIQTVAYRYGASLATVEAAWQQGLALMESSEPAPSEELPAVPITDKKVGKSNWREIGQAADQLIDLRHKASWSQDRAHWIAPPCDNSIGVMILGDAQLGSYGTNHKAFETFTDQWLATPDLYALVVGDMQQMAIKMRGVLEMMDNVLQPEQQDNYLESWFEEVHDRIIAWTWCNHAVMRQENQAGASILKRIVSRKVVYHSGIGHLDLEVGKETYKVAVSHFFAGRSKFNPVHAQMCYLREKAPDREIAAAGDSHVPAMMKYVEGGGERCVLNCGSFQTDSGYAKRFCELKTHPVFPVLSLDPQRHNFQPYWSVQDWARATGRA